MERDKHTSTEADGNNERIIPGILRSPEDDPLPQYEEVRDLQTTLETIRKTEGEFRVAAKEDGTQTWIQIEPVMEDEMVPEREESIVWFYNRFPNNRVSAETMLLQTDEEEQSCNVALNATGQLVQDEEGELRPLGYEALSMPGYQTLLEKAEEFRMGMQKPSQRSLSGRAAGPQYFHGLPFHGSDVEDVDSLQPYLHLLSSSQPAEVENIPEHDKKAIERFVG